MAAPTTKAKAVLLIWLSLKVAKIGIPAKPMRMAPNKTAALLNASA